MARSGGKLDFQKSYLYDGQQVCQNQAVMAFLKVALDYRYAIFTSHNFQRETTISGRRGLGRRALDPDRTERGLPGLFVDRDLKQHFHVSDNAALSRVAGL